MKTLRSNCRCDVSAPLNHGRLCTVVHKCVRRQRPLFGMSGFPPVPARPSSSEVLCCRLFACAANHGGASPVLAGRAEKDRGGHALSPWPPPGKIPIKAVPVVAPAVLTWAKTA